MKSQGRWLVAAAASGIVQSVVWFVLALLGVLVYTCVIDLPENADPTVVFGTRLSQYYIADQSCPSSQFYNVSVFVSQYVQLTSPDGVLIINSIIIAYSCLWLVASALLLWEALRQARPARQSVLWCWTVVAAFICLCDLGAFINFAVDYSNTVSRLRSLRSYLETQMLEMLSYPAFMMALMARGYFLWLLNVAAAVWVGFQALARGGSDDQDERTSLKHHFLSSIYNEKLEGVSAPWAVQSPVVGTAPRSPPWASGTPLEIPRPFRLGPPPPGRRRSAPVPEPDYDQDSVTRHAARPLSPPGSPLHAKDALRRQPPPLDEMPRRSALKKVPAPRPRYSGKTAF